LKSAGCEAVLILPGDMPLLRASDVESVLAQVPQDAMAPFALLVPSHDRLGTNALLLAPPDVIELRFGHDSFAFHMSRVAAQGLPVRFFENERIALDIDEPKDLERFLSYGFEDSEAARVARKLLSEPRAGQSPHSGDA
jgi:2-phospho-L-lactate/phosphoenolpyruvate guanylyltransferase